MTEVKFHFIKAPDYREVPVHGAFGGILPTGEGMFMSVYSERAPIPQLTVSEIDGSGNSNELLGRREGKDGMVRMVQFGMYLGHDQAVAMRDWLNTKIEQLEEVMGNGDAAA